MSKRILSVVVVVALFQVFFVRSVVADNEKPKVEARAKDYKWAYFAALPAYYLGVHIPVHEGSHALAIGLDSNYELGSFKPWLHFIDGGPQFLFGSVELVCRGADCDDDAGAAVIFLAPYITDTAIFTVSDTLLSRDVVNPTSFSGRALYFAGMVVPWWDFSYNAVWATDRSDANYIAQKLHVPRWSVMTIGMGVSAVGIARLWSGYKRAFPKHGRAKAKESNLLITPMGGTETVGVSVHMRF